MEINEDQHMLAKTSLISRNDAQAISQMIIKISAIKELQKRRYSAADLTSLVHTCRSSKTVYEKKLNSALQSIPIRKALNFIFPEKINFHRGGQFPNKYTSVSFNQLDCGAFMVKSLTAYLLNYKPRSSASVVAPAAAPVSTPAPIILHAHVPTLAPVPALTPVLPMPTKTREDQL